MTLLACSPTLHVSIYNMTQQNSCLQDGVRLHTLIRANLPLVMFHLCCYTAFIFVLVVVVSPTPSPETSNQGVGFAQRMNLLAGVR